MTRVIVYCTSLALALAMFDGCLIDCHDRAPSAASSHCHATTNSSGHAWQPTATCDHSHDLTWSETSPPRAESGAHAVAFTVALAASVPEHSAASSLFNNVSESETSSPPHGFALPLRV